MIDRRQFIISTALLLTGCGYRPLFSKTGDEPDIALALSRISVDEQGSRSGQLLRNELLSSMSPPGQRAETRYRLKLAVKEGQSFVSSLPRRKLDAVNYSRPVERWRYKLSASFSLHDLQTSGLATKGSSQSVVAYDVVREPIADLQARDAAMSRAAIELGQDIRLRLAAFLAR